MKLNEWQPMNKPASNSSGSNKSFKKRFDKIIEYHGDHLPAEVDFVYVNLLTPGSLNFTENYDNGDKVQFDIFIDDFDTEEWGIKIKVNGNLTDKGFGKGWPKLLNTLGAYIELPQAGDPEYNNLLTEWVEMKNNNSPSGSYKKRFEKLIKYHIDHASAELKSVTKKDIRDNYFRLSEHYYKNGLGEFDRDLVVSYDKDSDTFFLRIFVNSKEVYSKLCNSYEEFVEVAESYMFLPDAGAQEYDDLLTESLTEAVKNIPEKLYHATYKPFLKAIQQKGLGSTKRKMWADSKPGVVYLADDPWVAESYAETSEWVDAQEDPDKYLDNIIILEVDSTKLDASKLFIDKNVLLDEGEENATWEYHGVIPWEACEIFDSSIYKDFKTYENLWD